MVAQTRSVALEMEKSSLKGINEVDRQDLMTLYLRDEKDRGIQRELWVLGLQCY